MLLLLMLGLWASGSASADGPDSRAQVIHSEPAFYSRGARLAEIEGAVELLARISPSGHVDTVKVLSESHMLLRRSAVLAAWLSTYRPGVQGGVAVEDSVRLLYNFGGERVQGAIEAEWGLGNREHAMDLVSNQVCLYGNWLSGSVVLRLSEDRVYLDGIRVFPPIGDFNPEVHPEFRQKEVLRDELIFESRLFEREMVLLGADIDSLRTRTIRMLKKLPLVLDARSGASDVISVVTVYGDTLGFTLPDSTDGDEYFRLQPQMASAEDNYYGWLQRLHPQLGRRFVLFAFQTSSTTSLNNPAALEILQFLESPALRANDNGGYDLPEDIELPGPSLRASIQKPLRVERL